MHTDRIHPEAGVARVDKFRGLWTPDMPWTPYETRYSYGNVVVKRGAYAFWQQLTAGGGTTAGWAGHLGESDATPWEGAYLAVGTHAGGAAASSSDTDLGSTGTANAYYMHMTNGYPQFGDGDAMNGTYASIADPAVVVFQASFTTSVANFVWAEWGLVSVGTNPTSGGAAGTVITATDTGGTFDNQLINHKIESMGTKTSADTWVLTATFTIS